jgi:hypothetical protein
MMEVTDNDVEYSARVWWLTFLRGMTLRAAKIVVDAAMYGKGCIEGEVRAAIEAQKKKPTSEDVG